MAAPRVLVIACGALARELLAITQMNGLANVTVECLPASLHNRPSEIPELVRSRIRRARGLSGSGSGEVRVLGAETGIESSQVGEAHTDTAHTDTALADTALADTALVDTEVRVLGAESGGESSQFDEILIGYADCGTGGLLQQVCIDEGVDMLAGAHCYQFFATHEGFDRLQDHELGSFYLTDFLARNWERLIWDGLGIAKHPELRDMYFGNYTRLVYLEQTDDPKARAAAQACSDRLGLELHVEHTGYGELEETVVAFTRKAQAS